MNLVFLSLPLGWSQAAWEDLTTFSDGIFRNKTDGLVSTCLTRFVYFSNGSEHGWKNRHYLLGPQKTPKCSLTDVGKQNIWRCFAVKEQTQPLCKADPHEGSLYPGSSAAGGNPHVITMNLGSLPPCRPLCKPVGA